MFEEAIRTYLQAHLLRVTRLESCIIRHGRRIVRLHEKPCGSVARAMKRYNLQMSPEEAYLHEGRTGADTINIISARQRKKEATDEEIENIYETKSEIFNSLPQAERMPGAYELLQKIKGEGLTPVIVTGSGQKSLLERLNKNFPDIFRPEFNGNGF